MHLTQSAKQTSQPTEKYEEIEFLEIAKKLKLKSHPILPHYSNLSLEDELVRPEGYVKIRGFTFTENLTYYSGHFVKLKIPWQVFNRARIRVDIPIV